jgi:hypothetical protein
MGKLASIDKGVDLSSITDIKKLHEELYGRAMREGRELGKDLEFLSAVEELLTAIMASAERATVFDDYVWLGLAATQWQVVYSTTWNIPKTIDMPLPSTQKELVKPLPGNKALSADEVRDWCKRHAEYLGLLRVAKTGKPSSQLDMDWDWRQAETLFASDVLDGFPNFAGRIGSASYGLLEEVWLKDVKQIRAYFIWKKRGAPYPGQEREDYDFACDHIRRLLTDRSGKRSIKARPSEFGEAKAYIEQRYLTNGRVVHEGASEKAAAARVLIARKAERIHERRKQTESKYSECAENDLRNWIWAELYVKMFYENIVPAVMENGKENVLAVLKAFQYSKAPENCWWVINCFEAALAIYFLNANTIQELWKDSDSEPWPETVMESVARVSSWPKDYRIPDAVSGMFRFDGDCISFKGVMTEAQRHALLNSLSDRDARTHVEALFRQSRVVRREMTL